MKKVTTLLISLFAVAAVAATPKVESGTFAIDAAHSKVGFEIKHLVISTVEGRFDKFDGEIKLADKFSDSTIKANIDVGSINTGNSKRDDHLRSSDFFNAKKNPTMIFVSKKVTGSPANTTVVGDLTLNGVTKEVTLKGKVLGAVKGMQGETRAAFTGTTTIKRADFGLTWNKAVEAGPVVGDDVKISLTVEATKAEANKS